MHTGEGHVTFTSVDIDESVGRDRDVRVLSYAGKDRTGLAINGKDPIVIILPTSQDWGKIDNSMCPVHYGSITFC